MTKADTFIVDFVAKGTSTNEWKMVLVEQGPWNVPVGEGLARIQERLYESIDAVLSGQLAEKFPETKGASIVIQLDCYNVPIEEVREFVARFSAGIFQIPDYRRALDTSTFARNISFDVNFDSIN